MVMITLDVLYMYVEPKYVFFRTQLDEVHAEY